MGFAEEILCGNKRWYLVHCQARKEIYATNSLRHLLKLLVFFPECRVYSRGGTKYVPFFPGYVFVYADLEKVPRSCINTCPGVLRLVEFGGEPQAVPQSVIDAVSQQLNSSNESHVQPFQRFRPGDVVQVKQGPLQHLEMIFVGVTTPGGRVHVLLELLGRLKEVQIDVDMLEKATTASLISQELIAQKERYMQESGRAVQRPA